MQRRRDSMRCLRITSRALTSYACLYQHSYCVALCNDPSRIFFVCRYCHQRKVIDPGGSGLYETTTSTSTSARHLEQQKRGYGHLAPSKVHLTNVVNGSLRAILQNGKIKVTQAVANELLGFECQDFCIAAVSWIVKTFTLCASSNASVLRNA
jgi:hypothetical protein